MIENRHITQNSLDIAALLSETENERCGAVVVFGGTVRNLNDGKPVSGMSYSAHQALAAKTIAEIEQDALASFEIAECRCIHRYGELELKELSVLVVTRAAHRGPAFEAARWAIDEIKARTAIWKEEHYVGGDSSYLEGTPLATPE